MPPPCCAKRATKLALFFFQAEDGIRDRNVTGVQTCALPIFGRAAELLDQPLAVALVRLHGELVLADDVVEVAHEIGRASCRERVEIMVDAGTLKKKVEE